MPDLPIMLKLGGRRCVIVGGGAVALRRARTLLDVQAGVTVIAPHVDQALLQLPLQVAQRAYRAADLDDAMLVVIATDDPVVNEQVAHDARQRGILINRADQPEDGDFVVPAHAHHGPVTLAAYTNGISAAAAASIREICSAALDPDWPRLLTLVQPYRSRIQQAGADDERRRDCLRQLADQTMLDTLKSGGDAAVIERCQTLLASCSTP